MKNDLFDLEGFICALQWEELPQTVRTAAVFSVLDSVSAAAGAVNDWQAKKVTERYLRANGGSEIADIWGTGRRGPLSATIFLNAMRGHVLEMDDVHTRSKTHIGTVVVPAAWGMAQYVGASGKEFLTAVVAGYETMARIGMALGVTSHRQKGWHVTGTAGTFGAAAACSKLLKLDADQTLSALGMAGTQSCGLWAFLEDRATSKVLHPARAAVSGAEAALLAEAGMTGPAHILEARDGGMLAAMTDAQDIQAVSRELGSRYEILYMDRKPYPCCRSTHCAIDAALSLRNHYKLQGEDILSGKVETYQVGYQQCGCSKGSICPKTVTEAKFSTPYLVACALRFGRVGIQEVSQQGLLDPETMDLCDKIKVHPDEFFSSRYPDHWGCRLTLQLKNGQTVNREIQDAVGSVEAPLNEMQLMEKARSLLYAAYPDTVKNHLRSLIELSDASGMPEI